MMMQNLRCSSMPLPTLPYSTSATGTKEVQRYLVLQKDLIRDSMEGTMSDNPLQALLSTEKTKFVTEMTQIALQAVKDQHEQKAEALHFTRYSDIFSLLMNDDCLKQGIYNVPAERVISLPFRDHMVVSSEGLIYWHRIMYDSTQQYAATRVNEWYQNGVNYFTSQMTKAPRFGRWFAWKENNEKKVKVAKKKGTKEIKIFLIPKEQFQRWKKKSTTFQPLPPAPVAISKGKAMLRTVTVANVFAAEPVACSGFPLPREILGQLDWSTLEYLQLPTATKTQIDNSPSWSELIAQHFLLPLQLFQDSDLRTLTKRYLTITKVNSLENPDALNDLRKRLCELLHSDAKELHTLTLDRQAILLIQKQAFADESSNPKISNTSKKRKGANTSKGLACAKRTRSAKK